MWCFTFSAQSFPVPEAATEQGKVLCACLLGVLPVSLVSVSVSVLSTSGPEEAPQRVEGASQSIVVTTGSKDHTAALTQPP